MKIFLTLIQLLAVLLIGLWSYCFFKFNPNTEVLIYGTAMCTTGIIIGIALVANNLKSQIGKISALKREEEKKSISSTESQAKVKVLEAKIQTLEKALETALKSK